MAGSFRGTLDLGTGALANQGKEDVFVARLSSEGVPVWSKRFGDEQSQRATAVATDGAGDLIVAGVARGTVDFGGGPRTAAGAGEAFLVKLDPSGNHLWSALLGSGIPAAGDLTALSADAGGGIVISGSVDGDLVLDGMTQTLAIGSSFVARLDGDGKLLWEKYFADAAVSATTSRKGEIALSGQFSGTFSLGGASGPLVDPGPNPVDVVARLDAQGNEIYKLQFGSGTGSSSSLGRAAIDEAGNIVVIGDNQGDTLLLGTTIIPADKSYVVKLDPAGTVVYSRAGNQREHSYGLPETLTTIEGPVGESSTYIVGEFHRNESTLPLGDTSAATNGVPDFAGCVASDGSSRFVIGLGPHGELTTCRLFTESSTVDLEIGPDQLAVATITDGGSGRLLLSGGLWGQEQLDCATLDGAPLTLTSAITGGASFLASIAR
jgi:hypothetical protein